MAGDDRRRRDAYVYYHCTGDKGKCPEPYTREGALEDQFGDALSCLALDPDVPAVRTRSGFRTRPSLGSRQSSRPPEPPRCPVRGQARRRVSPVFFDRKAAEWRGDKSAAPSREAGAAEIRGFELRMASRPAVSFVPSALRFDRVRRPSDCQRRYPGFSGGRQRPTKCKLAGAEGFEPSVTDPKSVALPLGHAPRSAAELVPHSTSMRQTPWLRLFRDGDCIHSA